MTQKTKNILYVIDFFEPHYGGLEQVFSRIINNLPSDFHATILTTKHDPALPTHENKRNIDIYRVGSSRKNFVRYAIWKGFSLQKKFDIVHTTTFSGAIPGRILAHRFRCPSIITVHEVFGMLRYRFKGRYWGWLFKCYEWILFTLPFDRYHCVSHYTQNSLRVYVGIDDNKISMIHNGIDYNEWQPISPKKERPVDGNLTFFYYGHTGASKGVDTLITALPTIKKKFPQFHIIFHFLPGNESERYKEQLSAFNDFVEIYDASEKNILIERLQKSDVVIIPSISEGFCYAVAECGALNKPIITTDVGAIPEVASGNVIFIQPGSIESIIDGITKAYQNDFTIIPQKLFQEKEMQTKIFSLYHNLQKKSG